MKILSIETSCDDTGITLMETKGDINNASFKILANSSNSQIKIHAPYGGVYPMLAKREHIKNLPILLERVLKESKTKTTQIDLIAVTYGPGLEPALWTGIVFAKELGKKWKTPIIPVNHMEGHIISPFGKHKESFKINFKKDMFPMLALLVSGGHTELVLIKGFGKYKIIGKTLDDAAGEAYDKVARMMDLPYPGGPKISKLAEKERKVDHSQKHTGLAQNFSSLIFRKSEDVVFRSLGKNDDDGQKKFSAENFRAEQNNIPAFSLPRPMIYSNNFDFSFSGLKTAVLYLIKKIGKLDEKTKSKIALEFENAVAETLIYKTKKAKEKYKVKTIVVAGGVALNKHLQRQMKKAVGKDIKLLFPEKELTGDNSIMIGIAGYLQYIKNKRKVYKLSNIKANGSLSL